MERFKTSENADHYHNSSEQHARLEDGNVISDLDYFFGICDKSYFFIGGTIIWSTLIITDTPGSDKIAQEGFINQGMQCYTTYLQEKKMRRKELLRVQVRYLCEWQL